MILREGKTWLHLVLTMRKGTLLEEIWLRWLAVVLFSIGVIWSKDALDINTIGVTPTPFTIVGAALSIFMGFRNNAAYDRFWEGRKLWGGLVNTTRNLTRQWLSLAQAPAHEQAELREATTRFAHWLAAYIHALRHHLRGSRAEEEVLRLCGPDLAVWLREQDNRPMMLCQKLSEELRRARERSWLSVVGQLELERHLVELTNLQGACERIRSTPIPLSHTALTHKIIAAYLWLLPFGLVDTVGVTTPIVVLLVSFAFFGLDALGDEMEDPFGMDCNDLPLTFLSTLIERNVCQLAGLSDLPPLPKPSSADILH